MRELDPIEKLTLLNDYKERKGYSVSEIFNLEPQLRELLIQKFLSIPYDNITWAEDDSTPTRSPQFSVYLRDNYCGLGTIGYRGHFKFRISLRLLILEQFKFDILQDPRKNSYTKLAEDVLRLSILNNVLNYLELYKLLMILSGDKPLYNSSVLRNFRNSVGIKIAVTPPLQEIEYQANQFYSSDFTLEYNEGERFLTLGHGGKTLAIISGKDFDELEEGTPKSFLASSDLFMKWVIWLLYEKGFFK